VPLVRPLTVHVNGPLDHEHVAPLGEAETVYAVIGAPPSVDGAFQVTAT